MNGLATLLALTVMGVSFDWKPIAKNASSEAGKTVATAPEDGYEYLVYVEPELVELVNQGKIETIESNIPENIGPVRRVRIVLGARKPETADTNWIVGQPRTQPLKQTVAKPVIDEEDSPQSATAKRHTAYQQPNNLSPSSAGGQLQRLEQSFTNQLDATSNQLNNTAADFGRSLQSAQQQGSEAFRTAQNGFTQSQPTIGSNLRDGTRRLLDRTGDALRNTGEAVEGTVNNLRSGVRSAIGADGNRSSAIPPAPAGSNDYRPYSYNYSQPSSQPGVTPNFTPQSGLQGQGQAPLAGQQQDPRQGFGSQSLNNQSLNNQSPNNQSFVGNGNTDPNRRQEQSVLLQRDSQSQGSQSQRYDARNQDPRTNSADDPRDYDVNLQQPRGDYRLNEEGRRNEQDSRSQNDFADNYAQPRNQSSNQQQNYFDRNQNDPRQYDNTRNNRNYVDQNNYGADRNNNGRSGPAIPLLENQRPDERLVPVDNRQGDFQNDRSRDLNYDRTQDGDQFGGFNNDRWARQDNNDSSQDQWDLRGQNDPNAPNPNQYVPQPNQPGYKPPPAYDPTYVDNGGTAPPYDYNRNPLRPIGPDPRGNPLEDQRITPTSERLVNTAEKPWGLFVLSSCACIGSVFCNFFLGYSYLDARNKYRSALRRTGRAFGIGGAE